MALLALWNPNIQFLKTDGKINAGGKIIVTDHNDAESIPANYSDADGTTLNSSPMVLDALGRATCYIDDGSTYDLYVKDANGATLWTVSEMTPGTETIVVRGGFSVSSNDSSISVTISVNADGVTNYDLSIQKEIDRATEAEKGLAVSIEAEKNRAEDAESALSESIADKAGTASPLMDGKASVGNSLKYAREDHVHPSDTSREEIANKTTVVLGTSDSKYPTDKAVAKFVNSSIATNTANYISNNGEPFTSVEQLEAYSGPVTNNDYAFVTGIDSEGNSYYDRYKATVSGETVTWALEYRLNNSSFTAAQWSAINSGITSVLVAKIHDHSNKDVLDGITSSDVANWNSKMDSLQTNDITIANGDKLVVTDASDSNKVARASLTFDGATTDQMLSKKGEWNDTIAKARAVVDYGSPSKAIEIGWSGPSVTSTKHFAVYIDSANGYNRAIKDCRLETVKKLINGTSVGSTAVPVFINANGETQVCTDDFVHDGDVTSTYYATGTAPVNGTAVAAAIGGLDVSSVGGDGKYISAISETDGKISATATTMDTTPTANSTKAVTSDGIKKELDNKLNVDGSNATNEGVTAMMRKVPSGTGHLSDESSYFGDSDLDHAKIVRRPVLDIWNYVKDNLGTAGSKERPVYFDGGVPKECDTVLPCSIIDSGSATGYGVYVGGNSKVDSYTRCYCAFLLTATADPDLVAHTYIGTFTFRHGSLLNYELKCLTGTPKYPMRIAVSYNKNSDSTYNLGAYVIPADPTVNTYANYKLTRIASADFTWTCTAINAAECAALDNDGAKPALVPIRLFFDGGGSNVTTTGGSWLPTFDEGTIKKCRGIVDLSVQVDMSVINQTTYVGTLATYTITLVNSAGTDILSESLHQKGRMPRQTKSSTSGGTVDISHTHRFVFPITASCNLFAGYRPKITLPSNYPLDSNAQVSVSAICSGIVHPYYGKDTSF